MSEGGRTPDQMSLALSRIAAAHAAIDVPEGTRPCRECDWSWPCPTYWWATTARNTTDPWDPNSGAVNFHDSRNADYMDVQATDPVMGIPVGVRRVFTHTGTSCRSEPACPVHRPSEHHMRDWPKLWRADTGVLERTCLHGIGHPDPDQFAFWEKIGVSWRKVHGCDGCCKQPVSEMLATEAEEAEKVAESEK